MRIVDLRIAGLRPADGHSGLREQAFDSALS